MRFSPGISTPRRRGMAGFRIADFRLGDLPLALLVARVGAADHAHDVLALDDLAGFTQAFDGGADFHKSVVFSDCKIGVWGKNSPVEVSPPAHLTLNRRALRSTVPEGDPALGQIVGRHLYHNSVSWQDTNEMKAHFPTDM